MKKLLLGLIIFCKISLPLLAQTKTRLNHIAVGVSNLAYSNRFYQEVLMLDTIPNPINDGEHTWYRIGGQQALHLIQKKVNGPFDKYNHLCFSVTDINRFIEALARFKVDYESWTGQPHTITTRADGVHQVYFKDPDGYWIEVNDARE